MNLPAEPILMNTISPASPSRPHRSAASASPETHPAVPASASHVYSIPVPQRKKIIDNAPKIKECLERYTEYVDSSPATDLLLKFKMPGQARVSIEQLRSSEQLNPDPLHDRMADARHMVGGGGVASYSASQTLTSGFTGSAAPGSWQKEQKAFTYALALREKYHATFHDLLQKIVNEDLLGALTDEIKAQLTKCQTVLRNEDLHPYSTPEKWAGAGKLAPLYWYAARNLVQINDVDDGKRIIRSVHGDLIKSMRMTDGNVFELTSFLLKGRAHPITKKPFEVAAADMILTYQSGRKKESHIIDCYLSSKAEETEYLASSDAPIAMGENPHRGPADAQLGQKLNSVAFRPPITTMESHLWEKNSPSMPGRF